ncbi:pirin domain protein (plasmid) [Natrialba magadii ATCC 43099]|uniref:Pirin domain protein n=1 Tax=Natrialba magadii (strain ATCC 43099 / DSM 3394 / CCM 3739 / CIP 104546 / IAM 13178 / JCM 8861 / NBRC 102185 / NCIMB 2190 / MS3) TaxID=547559 RepID=D3T0S6_NATMM|nr:pirin family protein [Natrialba magadii]ADD07185.1 pirin domain protein [Natrialba magadii ATCC 43099]ELY34486.1 Pirin domain-containing protein [Natrialba magadii ATCC 43099]
MTLESTELYKASRTTVSQEQGNFRTHFNFPGRNRPSHEDHGYGPLATVVESYMDPDTLIPMHQHRNEEIISWIPDGVMRHDDQEGNELVTDSDHLMVMGAGQSFWHEERTLADDPPLRMLQIFVRPHSLELPATIQHEPIPEPVANEWRHLFEPADGDGTAVTDEIDTDGANADGTENDETDTDQTATHGTDTGAPLTVRNDVHFYDSYLDEDASVALPARPGWDTYFYVFDGAVTVADTTFETAESGLLVHETDATVTAQEASLLVAFVINPDAPITRQGTIGR